MRETLFQVRRARVQDAGGIAGYCRVVPPSRVASLFVLPERRRGGVGAALLAAGLDELRPHSAHATLGGAVMAGVCPLRGPEGDITDTPPREAS